MAKHGSHPHHGHAHAHGHDHAHTPFPGAPGQLPDEQVQDPGLQALAEALRVGFLVLKLVIVGVVVAFLLSGAFRLEENEVGIVLRFGQPARVVDTAGWKWKWPEPVEEVVRVPKAQVQQELEIDSFWYRQTAREKAGLERAMVGETLRLAIEGYSLTASAGAIRVAGQAVGETEQDGSEAGEPTDPRPETPGADYNLVHTRWRLRYVIRDPERFVERLWPGKGDYAEVKNRGNVTGLLQSAVADSVVVVSARRDIDWIVWERPLEFKNEVRRRLAARLEVLDVGIELAPDGLELMEKVPPRQVKAAFDAASSAGIEAQRLVNEATAQASEIVATAQADADNLVAQAQGYRKKVVSAAEADASYLREVVGEVRKAALQRVPGEGNQVEAGRQAAFDELMGLTVDQLYQEALREVVSNADEVFVLSAPEGAKVEWRPLLNRDSTLTPRDEQETQGTGQANQTAGQ